MSYLLIVFQGPSGSGKSTLQVKLGIPKIITWTSREPRTGEINGRDYHFTTKVQMITMYNQHRMLEMTEYQGNYYGTSMITVQESNGPSSIVMDVKGALKLKELLKDKVLLIGVATSIDQCRQRLHFRNMNDKEIERRLLTYEDEIKQLSHCDLIIYNSNENRQKSEKIIQYIGRGLEKEPHEL